MKIFNTLLVFCFFIFGFVLYFFTFDNTQAQNLEKKILKPYPSSGKITKLEKCIVAYEPGKVGNDNGKKFIEAKQVMPKSQQQFLIEVVDFTKDKPAKLFYNGLENVSKDSCYLGEVRTLTKTFECCLTDIENNRCYKFAPGYMFSGILLSNTKFTNKNCSSNISPYSKEVSNFLENVNAETKRAYPSSVYKILDKIRFGVIQ